MIVEVVSQHVVVSHKRNHLRSHYIPGIRSVRLCVLIRYELAVSLRVVHGIDDVSSEFVVPKLTISNHDIFWRRGHEKAHAAREVFVQNALLGILVDATCGSVCLIVYHQIRAQLHLFQSSCAFVPGVVCRNDDVVAIRPAFLQMIRDLIYLGTELKFKRSFCALGRLPVNVRTDEHPIPMLNLISYALATKTFVRLPHEP